MLVEKVSVGGEMSAVWAHLLTTLQANRYEIDQQIPGTHVSARRGKKLSNLLLSTPRYGFRELDVDLYPSGRSPQDTEVTFKFVFPAYGVTWPSIKKDCRELVDQFARRVRSEPAPAAGRAAPGGLTCAACHSSNPPDARFCRGCGGVLTPAVAEPPATPPSPRCEQCQAESPAGAVFCSACGARLPAPAPAPAVKTACDNCHGTLAPGAAFCSACGTKV
jgi:ribosomal protein L40E